MELHGQDIFVVMRDVPIMYRKEGFVLVMEQRERIAAMKDVPIR